MSATLKFGAGKWAAKEGSVLAYNDLNNNFKPLPFTFTRASSATRVNESGLIESVSSGIPRIDYLNNADGHLLLEPSRTNLATQSENFATSWTRSGIATPTLESISAPNGSSSVYRLTTNNSDGSLSFTYNTGFSQTSGTTYTVTVYAKSYSGENQLFGLYGNGSGSSDAYSGNLIATSEWQRFTCTYTASNTSNAGICKGINELAFDILFWGFQIEAGSYATSYIPTSGSSVTRVADACRNAGNSQVIGQSEGVVFVDIKGLNLTGSSQSIGISDGTSANRFDIRINSSNVVSAVGVFGGVVAFSMGSYSATQSEDLKIALSYKNNDFRLFVNGSKNAEDTSGTVSGTFTEVSCDLNDSQLMNSPVKEIKLYNTSLSDSELIALTS